jgi:hypothetical protein
MGADRMPGGADRGFRISDSDRDQISAVLGQHEAEGRLTVEELDQRLGILYAAKTREQAAAVVADLPPLAATETRGHLHLGHEHSDETPALPQWLTAQDPASSEGPAQAAAANVPGPATAPPAREDRAADRRREKLRRDENAIGHTFQATRRAINTQLETANAAGRSDEVADLKERLRAAQRLAGSARQAVGAGDRAEVQNLLARLRGLAEPAGLREPREPS